MDVTQITIIEIVTCIAAILSIIVTLVCNLITIISNREIAKNAQKEENKRAEAGIEANLTANARIEWIQNVRHATAEYITSCYEYKEYNITEKDKQIAELEKKKLLLEMYFGPDTDKAEKLDVDIFNKIVNDGKNDKIVEFINTLYKEVKEYPYYRTRIDLARGNQVKCDECKEITCKNRYGIVNSKEDCESHKEDTKEEIDKLQSAQYVMQEHLEQLSEVIRIYCKIEWNKAKNGK